MVEVTTFFIEKHNAKTYICGEVFDPVAWGNLLNVEVFDEGGSKDG